MAKRSPSKSPAPRVHLREAREVAGWSQEELAERLGTVQVTVSRWETGETTPSPYLRQKLSHLLGKTLQELDLAGQELSPANSTSPAPEDMIFDPIIPPLLHTPLIGREQELAHLRAQLTHGRTAPLAICGLPGVGKTTLACALAHDPRTHASFPDGVLWVGLGTHPDLHAHLRRWGTLLGLSLSQFPPLQDGNQEKDLLLAVRRAIGTRRLLIILDDAWTKEDAFAFQRIVGVRCATLITTRFPMLATSQDQNPLALHELTIDQSLDLLSLLAPQIVDRERQQVRSLIQAVGGLPLALTLIGNYLRLQGTSRQTRRIQMALEHLHSATTRLHLSEPRPSIDHYPSLPDEQPLSLSTIIGVTDQHLHPAARQALYALSLFPAKPSSFSEEAALAITTCSIEDLDELLDMGLLEAVGDKRYTIHQTITDYARLHLNDPQPPQERLIAYALTFLEQHRIDYELLAQETNLLLLALEAASVLGKQDELVRGVCAIVPFLLLRGKYTQAHRHLLDAQQAVLALHDQRRYRIILLHLGGIWQANKGTIHAR